jgi:hypothetical protein
MPCVVKSCQSYKSDREPIKWGAKCHRVSRQPLNFTGRYSRVSFQSFGACHFFNLQMKLIDLRGVVAMTDTSWYKINPEGKEEFDFTFENIAFNCLLNP